VDSAQVSNGHRRSTHSHLWPYALRTANDLLNSTPDLKTGNTHLTALSSSNIASNPIHWQPFGCPVYVLDSVLQAGKKIGNWLDRARVGVYLKQSSQHAGTVALVLSLLTCWLASPQFHVRMDATFQTLLHSAPYLADHRSRLSGNKNVTSSQGKACKETTRGSQEEEEMKLPPVGIHRQAEGPQGPQIPVITYLPCRLNLRPSGTCLHQPRLSPQREHQLHRRTEVELQQLTLE
jgi:hypothetical protein